jgi:hypothetical protein
MKTIRFNLSLFIFLALSQMSFTQNGFTTAEEKNFKELTSYSEICAFVETITGHFPQVKSEIIGKSVKGKNIYALKFSSGKFGKEKSKLKVLIFAQQHGNEPAGKEAVLLVIKELIRPENKHFLEKMDIAIILQMNPDGAELNQRLNANNKDLNRNHLILTEPETLALHTFFDKYLFDVNIDVHEYSPYGEEWKSYGYRKNSRIMIGTCTNTNIYDELRKFSNEIVLPELFTKLKTKKINAFIYCPGGPPEINYIRHSTFDVNDGRQSFGIMNTLSFIQEGMNGKETELSDLKMRAFSQKESLICFLEIFEKNAFLIKQCVQTGRTMLCEENDHSILSIQEDHFNNGTILELPVLSYTTGNDTIVRVHDYRPVVKSIFDIYKPIGYLIPKNDTLLINWIYREGYISKKPDKSNKLHYERYRIKEIDSIDFERDIIINPIVEKQILTQEPDLDNYIYIPCNQIKGNKLVLALEPKSMLGLGTYKEFEYLIKKGEAFPVLRVIEN